MKNYILIIIFFIPFQLVQGQFHSEYFTKEPGKDSSKFLFSIKAAGFFHNNEFFSTDEEGYTLPGNYFQPVLRYRLNSEISLSGGMHFLKYHGQNGFNQLDPFFNINYNFSDKGNILIGSFNGGDYNQLPEALMARELHFSDVVMNGVLIDYSNGRRSSRTWIDWERFIEKGDPFREVFTFSFSAKYSLIKDELQELKIPFYFIANHKGGQINVRTQPVETIADFSGGFHYKRVLENGLFEQLEINGLTFIESDVKNEEEGYAFLGEGGVNGDLISLSGGYFYGRRWESIAGNPLFFSGDMNSVNSKSLILLKAGLAKNIGNANSFSLRFEAYYDTSIQKMQYLYGVYLVVNESVFGF